MATPFSASSCGLSVVGEFEGTHSEGVLPDAGDAAPGDGATLPGDGSVPPDEPPPDQPPPVDECPPGVVCDVIASTTVLDVAVNASALYWLDSNGAIGIAAKDGSGARTLVSGERGSLAGLEADEQYVYWTASGKLRRASARDGSGASTLADVRGGCLRRGRTPTELLASAPEAGNIYVVQTNNGERTTLVTQATNPWGVVVVEPNDVFYTNYDSESGRIRKGRPGGGVTSVFLDGQRGPRCMATDGVSLWWANRDSGTLMKSPVSTANAQAFVTNQRRINGVALDATYVYWSYEAGIRRRTK